MNQEEPEQKTPPAAVGPEETKMDRRDFFLTAGRLLLPTLGVLGLSLGSRAQAASDCSRSCTGGCDASCGDFCKGGCSLLCTRSCANDCDGKCQGSCARSCANSCEGFYRGMD